MALVGILYLAFEDAILGTETRKYSVSRTIVGIQVSEMRTERRSLLTLLDRAHLSSHGGYEVSRHITTSQTRTSTGNTVGRLASRQ